jgi:Uri superfamily endonuclease
MYFINFFCDASNDSVKKMLNCLPSLPKQTGSYALFVALEAVQHVSIGRLGRAVFNPGIYIYLGSAAGPGGLKARLGRHLRGGGKRHWHIDYLRAVGEAVGFCAVRHQDLDSMSTPVECRWSQALAARLDVSVPFPGFGCSDCKAGCPAHLIAINDIDDFTVERYRQILVDSLGISPDLIACQPST